jgi:hypothetical protein
VRKGRVVNFDFRVPFLTFREFLSAIGFNISAGRYFLCTIRLIKYNPFVMPVKTGIQNANGEH